MSAPQQQPQPKSPTPSKSSLRRTQGISSSSQRNLLPPPSPRFQDHTTTEVRYSPRSPPNQTLEYDSNDDDDDDDEDEAAEDALIKGPIDDQDAFTHHEGSYFPITNVPELTRPFEPLFTLIEDKVTNEHHHPSIHYIFADDDHEIITEAAVRSLEEDELEKSSASTTAEETEADVHSMSGSRLPATQPGIKEHYLIVDVQPSDNSQPTHSETQSQFRSLSQGPTEDLSQQDNNVQSQPNMMMTPPFVVSSVASLSPDWQIRSATITSAPTMSEEQSGKDEGFMLRIEGRGFAHLGSSDILASRGKKAAAATATTTNTALDTNETMSIQERENESLDEMIDRFQNNLNEIRKLIDVDLPDATSKLDMGPTEMGNVLVTQPPTFDFEAQD